MLGWETQVMVYLFFARPTQIGSWCGANNFISTLAAPLHRSLSPSCIHNIAYRFILL